MRDDLEKKISRQLFFEFYKKINLKKDMHFIFQIVKLERGRE